jgi:NADP-dependent 3-hydroxy acid dehydrogenase YdfG
MQDFKPQFAHIVITGASSGIGEALALHYAAKGVRLSLTGRDAARLKAVSARCRSCGASVEEKIISVTDREGMATWLYKIDDHLPVDLLIANAGVSAGMGDAYAEGPNQVRKLLDVNIYGVFNTIEPLLPRMIQRGRGNIALMASLAGFRGWPGAPAYCATKAAVKAYGEGLRGSIAHAGVKVHVICPGFVKSRMTAVNKFPMPLLMEAPRAARIIAKGIAKNRGRIAFPALAYFFIWLCASLPDTVGQKMLTKMPAKDAGCI